MIRIDTLIFGYRVFSVKPKDTAKALTALLRHNMTVKIKDNSFIVKESDAKRIEKILTNRVEFCKSEMRGLGGFVYKNRLRIGFFVAVFLSALLFLFSGLVVWDVRVEGSEYGYEEEIKKDLAECGFSSGTLWHKVDKSELEVTMLQKSEYISWININRRGTVAYVNVIDKVVHEEKEEKTGYSNVVASSDAIIEEITVSRGIAMVKVGDSVKKGDILICGVLPMENGGGYCYAEGTVIGRVSDVVSVIAEAKSEEKLENKKVISEITLNFFNFPINIFKSYRNFDNDYDIIECDEEYFLPGGSKLPVSLHKKYISLYTRTLITLSSQEQTLLASKMLSEALSDRLSGATLLRINTQGEFNSRGYSLSASIVLSENIGYDAPFETEK